MNSTNAGATRPGTFSNARSAGPATLSRYGSGNARRQAEPGAQLVTSHEVTGGVGGIGLRDLLLCGRITRQRDGLLHRGQIVLRQQHQRSAARPRQPKPTVRRLHLLRQLGEVGRRVLQRLAPHVPRIARTPGPATTPTLAGREG